MKSAKETTINYQSKNLDYDLHKDYAVALKDSDFKKLVTRLKVPEDIAMKYTSKLENTVHELNNCKKCKGLLMCENSVTGCVNYPRIEGNRLHFDYVACKYMIKDMEEKKYASCVFLEPIEIQNASLANIFVDDKKRMHLIRYVKSFYTAYKKDKHIKGCYLHGSFGSGKTYILAALLNEIAKTEAKVTIVYYPEMLRNLKESFNDDFGSKMELLKTSDILLIDDIGAETVTGWSRDEILGTILQYRMDNKLPTFFTSNLTIEELEVHLANTKTSVDIVKARRIIERIKQLTEDLELISDNRRK